MTELFFRQEAGDMTMLFFRQKETYAFTLVPTALCGAVTPHRTAIPENEANKSYLQRFPLEPDVLESMMQLKFSGDPAFAQCFPGRSMRNSGSVSRLQFLDQRVTETSVRTRFRHPEGVVVENIAEFEKGKPYLVVSTRLIHQGKREMPLEYLAGVSLGMLSPFAPDDGPGRYFVHRFQSAWAAEGRPLAESMDEANLEMSWQAAGLRNIRFGVNGSMPVRGFFPFLALEDREAGVFWGIQAEAPASWELEIARTGDFLSLSGGCPGRETGSWTRVLHPGETFDSMKMIVSCVHGSLDDLCGRMQQYQQTAPPAEKDTAVIFNEYCTTWGRPWKKNLEMLLTPASACGAKYFVMDAGWFRNDAKENRGCVGDWNPKDEMYPGGGFAGMTEAIRQAGMIPGIWFEFEICLENSATAKAHPDWFLTLDGTPVRTGPRMFLDLRKEEVRNHLREKVIAFLRKYRIGYMKVDYNGSTGGWCDGPENPAENHRKYMESVLEFFEEIRRDLPDLVLEICASGGHRCTPAWGRIADLFSVSDAHEGVEIPLISANTLRMVPAVKNQTWVTLRPWNDEKRLFYLLCGGFLGRLCLSGDLDKLSAGQFAVVRRACDLYRAAAETVCTGKFHVEQHWNRSFLRPEGWQSVRFRSGKKQLTVLHTFGNPPEEIAFPAKSHEHTLFAPQSADCKVQNGMFRWLAPAPFSALILSENEGEN